MLQATNRIGGLLGGTCLLRNCVTRLLLMYLLDIELTIMLLLCNVSTVLGVWGVAF